MIKVNGFNLPDGEKHLVPFLTTGPQFAGGPTYQLHKLLPALPHVKNFGYAIDVGAHAGLWTRVLARMFTQVLAFEPVQAHFDCLEANMREYQCGNVVMFKIALGNQTGVVHLTTGPGSSGDTYVTANGGEHLADMTRLDVCVPAHMVVDFIKIDCEGFEYFVLQGGEQLIKRCKPVLIVEQKTGKGKQFGLSDRAALDLLESWGASRVFDWSGDYCYAWVPNKKVKK